MNSSKLNTSSSNGVKADAVLLHIKPTGTHTDTRQEVRLKLQVFSKGRNFVTEFCEVLNPSQLNGLQAGNFIRVEYNPFDTNEIFLLTA